eukprot:scaffold86053_cov47-Phaeocystis_antarctica.AAC.2
MKVTLAILGLGSVAALQLGGSVRTVQLGGARAPSRTSRVICGWGPDPVWTALEVGSIKDAAEGLKAITIKPADGAADAFTVAGQYVQIREIGAEKAGIFAIASSPTKAGDFEFLIKEQPESDWSPGTGWLTDSKAGLALEMSQVMGPGFKIDGVLDDIDNVRQRGQSVPPLAAPQLGSCTSGCAWWLWAARHSQGETQPLGAQPPARVLACATSKVADCSASDHAGAAVCRGLGHLPDQERHGVQGAQGQEGHALLRLADARQDGVQGADR